MILYILAGILAWIVLGIVTYVLIQVDINWDRLLKGDKPSADRFELVELLLCSFGFPILLTVAFISLSWKVLDNLVIPRFISPSSDNNPLAKAGIRVAEALNRRVKGGQ